MTLFQRQWKHLCQDYEASKSRELQRTEMKARKKALIAIAKCTRAEVARNKWRTAYTALSTQEADMVEREVAQTMHPTRWATALRKRKRRVNYSELRVDDVLTEEQRSQPQTLRLLFPSELSKRIRTT